MTADNNNDKIGLFRDKAIPTEQEERLMSGALPGLLRSVEALTGERHNYRSPSRGLGPERKEARAANAGKAAAATGPDARSMDAVTLSGSQVTALLSSIEAVLNELWTAQHALKCREAELATGVPIVLREDADASHMAERLDAVLCESARAMRCHAAGLYLLNDDTSLLKLRASWGLPKDRLTLAPRPLKGALADLEALLGHAVVLEDDLLADYWNPPEDFASAVCVPIATATTILGTLWFFCNDERPYSDTETNIAEMAAGRIAADLEREVAVRESVAGTKLKKQAADAERLQQNQLPTIAPMLDDWDVAGWTQQLDALGGDFHDWFTLPDQRLALATADVMDGGLEAAMAATGVHAAVRAHGEHELTPDRLIERVNTSIWTGSAGEQHGSLFVGFLDPRTGELLYSSAGDPSVLLVTDDEWRSLTRRSPLLGCDPESCFTLEKNCLGADDILLVASDKLRETRSKKGRRWGEAAIARFAMKHREKSATDLANLLREKWSSYAGGLLPGDASMLVIKRMTP